MKKTRLPPEVSMKRPGEMRLTSSRCSNCCEVRSICAFDQGVITKETTATSATIGSAKRSTGPTQRSRLSPPELNQTTISLSCQLRMSTIRMAMKIESASSAGRFVSDEYAISSKTERESTLPPAASPRMVTSPTASTTEKSTVKTPPALLANSLTSNRLKIMASIGVQAHEHCGQSEKLNSHSGILAAPEGKPFESGCKDENYFVPIGELCPS